MLHLEMHKNCVASSFPLKKSRDSTRVDSCFASKALTSRNAFVAVSLSTTGRIAWLGHSYILVDLHKYNPMSLTFTSRSENTHIPPEMIKPLDLHHTASTTHARHGCRNLGKSLHIQKTFPNLLDIPRQN